jgi:hypothetical protein
MNTEIVQQFEELIAKCVPQAPIGGHPYVLGKWYAIRTLTMIYTGQLKAVYGGELVLSSAAWIADTGRWMQFCQDPANANEIEPFAEDAIVSRQNIVDGTPIKPFVPIQK